MLGGDTYIIKTLTETRDTERGTFVYAPVMMHYTVSSDVLVAVHVPYVHYSFDENFRGQSGSTLGDINILGKYQFYRKDGTGKTLRMVLKTLQTLPTGKKLNIDEMSTGQYAGYYGTVLGYESLKFGISKEMGYQWEPDGMGDRLVNKLGFGLPLLKPTYPVNQLNLYFEYTSEVMFEQDMYRLMYAQGVQYAKNKWTWEAAIQFPLIQNGPEIMDINHSIFIGTRYILN